MGRVTLLGTVRSTVGCQAASLTPTHWMPGALPPCDNRCPQVLQNACWGQNPPWLGATWEWQSDQRLPPQLCVHQVSSFLPEASRHTLRAAGRHWSVMSLSRGLEGFAGSGNGGRQGERPAGQGDSQTEVQERGRPGWAHCTKEHFFVVVFFGGVGGGGRKNRTQQGRERQSGTLPPRRGWFDYVINWGSIGAFEDLTVWVAAIPHLSNPTHPQPLGPTCWPFLPLGLSGPQPGPHQSRDLSHVTSHLRLAWPPAYK